jgi:hypothetical protein
MDAPSTAPEPNDEVADLEKAHRSTEIPEAERRTVDHWLGDELRP